MAKLLAKPEVSLKDHLLQVAELAKELSSQLGLSADLSCRAFLAALFHDLGKATRDFQRYMRLLGEGKETEARRLKPRVFPHALASLNFVFLTEKVLFGGPFLATGAVLSHHSPLGGDLYRTWEARPEYEDGLRELITCLIGKLKSIMDKFPDLERDLKTVRGIPPLLLLEKANFQREGRRFSLRGLLKEAPQWGFARVKAVLRLADWLVSAGKKDPGELFLKNGRRAVEDHFRCRNLSPYQFQRRAGRLSKESLALRAPTGSGKTEALLLWAGEAERIVYLLPTQATVNAMYQRLRKIYGPERVGLAHGHASYILHRETEEDLLWERLSSSVFAKPVTVATIDQFLLACLHGRHWEERLTLSASAHLVFDEIHSYEPYTLGLLKEALNDFPGKYLAFASATLPKTLLRMFPTAAFMEAEDRFFSRRRHRLVPVHRFLKENLPEIISAAKKGQKVLVILNTVLEAQEIYRLLCKSYSGPVHLFHSRFVFRDRLAKESMVKEAKAGTILVSTQVVEVSLDISYDVLFSELAPLDALVQRLGRVNRRGARPPAKAKFFTLVGEGSKRVYPKGILERSRSLLENLSEIPQEREWVDAVNRLYEEIVRTESFQEDFELGRQTLREIRETLGCYTIDLADEELRARFATRRGTPSVEVLPETFLTEAWTLKDRKEGWRLVELLVPVPIWWLRTFKDWFYPSEDFGLFVTRLPYNPEEGLLTPTGDGTPEGYELW
ncbi:CRISPR-associated helicase/endonuclease Cas3 [Thermosulfurimonas dismutans]|uniref:CRISPR-associated helicase Cas3 n=1 Tax=Thermosulfurimonas dismutans TaxID=999894 RepID=A0A179D1Z0_9BACT|nr:CRISPR-associated helicase/endonuclease Cas3 [Thermosulfurimonas dismutans]OAQ20070.1 CRISPR-associated helicase Cas3 [Thermosulfurimonas dismutans]